MHRLWTGVTVRKSPRGDWIAWVSFPKCTPAADKCSGQHSRRFDTPEAATAWLAFVIKHHLTKRAKHYERARRARLDAANPHRATDNESVRPR